MGRARWANPLWPAFLEGQAEKMIARIELELIGPAQISLQPIRIRAGPLALFIFFLLLFNNYMV